MKLRAVRLMEVGLFSAGNALEGLSGGFDVLAGPNESGKSTIFRAIEALFKIPHTSTAQAARDLASASGGAPLIEVDFEIDDVTWRMRKRYLAQKSAELVQQRSGAVLRGPDAETKLAQLLGGRLDRSKLFGLMWVGQQKAVTLPDGDPDIARSLGQLIEDEIAEAGGGGLARRVRAQIQKDLDGLITKSNRRPKTGTPYKAAVDLVEGAKAEFNAAVAAQALAAKRLSDLEGARAKLQALHSPEAVASRADTLAALRDRMAKIVHAEDAVRLANQTVAASDARYQQAQARFDSLANDIAEADRLRASVHAYVKRLTDLAVEVEAASGEGARLNQRQTDAREAAGELQRSLDVHSRHERQQHASQQITALRKRLEQATAGAARLEDLDRQLSALPVTDVVLRELMQAQAEVERSATLLAAGLPRVRIDYLTGAEGRIRLADMPVTANGDVVSGEIIQLDIEGIGRITVTAPTALVAEGASPGQRAGAAQERLRALLAQLQVSSVSEAEALYTARAKCMADRDTVRLQLNTVAPDGVADLTHEHDLAVATLGELGAIIDPPAMSPGILSGELETLRAELTDLEQRTRHAQARQLDASKRWASATAEQASAIQRLAQLDANLPSADVASATLASGQCERAALLDALQSAIRDQSAWQSAIPDVATRAALARDLSNAERGLREADLAQQTLALEIRGLESALERDQHDGVGQRVIELEERLASAQQRVSGFEGQVRELELLALLLDAEGLSRRSTELAPVVARLRTLAQTILPGAAFELGDAMRVEGLVRAGQRLAPTRLSGGTQEQIAVLVRLAYGQLLAERGASVPLVLDDALVYADDARFSAFVALLTRASARHQIIMLTCQSMRLKAIEAEAQMKLVHLTPWRG